MRKLILAGLVASFAFAASARQQVWLREIGIARLHCLRETPGLPGVFLRMR